MLFGSLDVEGDVSVCGISADTRRHVEIERRSTLKVSTEFDLKFHQL